MLGGLYPNFPLFTGLDREIILEFRPSNPFKSIRIATDFPVVKSCNAVYGLFRKDLLSQITCIAHSNTIRLSGFALY